MNETIPKFVNLTILMHFFLKKKLILDINIIFHFKYLHIDFKRKSYFYIKKMKVFLSK